MRVLNFVLSGSLSSGFDGQACSHVETAVHFRLFLGLDVEESDSEDSDVLSEADKANESDNEDIFNRDKMNENDENDEYEYDKIEIVELKVFICIE